MAIITRDKIQQVYLAFFGRPGDPLGIDYWLYCQSNNDIKNIARILYLQDEYKFITRSMSLEIELNQFYENLFSRSIKPDELSFLLNAVKNGDKVHELICNLLDLTLHQDRDDELERSIDAQTLSNKLCASELFTQQIQLSNILKNSYQPESRSPWISGKTFESVKNFFSLISRSNLPSDLQIKDFLLSITREPDDVLDKPAISMENVSLRIPVIGSESRSFTKSIFKSATGGEFFQVKRQLEIEALSNLSLQIMQGERIALIGHNGSGKSSFLRLISGIYLPSSGNLNIYINVHPMLEKSFLTSSELSGIEAAKAHYLLKNSNLNGFDEFISEIVDFSGLGSYISLPIKSYSEGMSARLMFSLLTSDSYDCLAIDEGLGAGDANFYEKAERRMKSFVDSSGTLLLASHSDELLRKFCFRGLVFNQGSIVFDGSLEAALNYYHNDHLYKHAG